MAKPVYTVAMAQSDGCLIMLLNRHVVGAMTREQTIAFAHGLINWVPDVMVPEGGRPTLKLINGDVPTDRPPV
jgi:hypothetical protein